MMLFFFLMFESNKNKNTFNNAPDNHNEKSSENLKKKRPVRKATRDAVQRSIGKVAHYEQTVDTTELW